MYWLASNSKVRESLIPVRCSCLPSKVSRESVRQTFLVPKGERFFLLNKWKFDDPS